MVSWLLSPPGSLHYLIISDTRCPTLQGNYLDYNDLVVVDPSLLTVLDSFLLCGDHIRLVAGPSREAAGVYIAGNEFYGPCGANETIVAEVGAGGLFFAEAVDVTVL